MPDSETDGKLALWGAGGGSGTAPGPWPRGAGLGEGESGLRSVSGHGSASLEADDVPL